MVDPKGQNILYRNQLVQKDLMIQMLSERLNEKDETITDLKILDINSDVAIEDIDLPDEEEAKQRLPAEIGLLYCNKLFYLERTLKEPESKE